VKRVLVSGGAGYVGSVLTPALVKADFKVRVFDTFWFWNSPDEFLEATQLNRKSVEIIQGDLRNAQDVRRAVAECDTVIQLACVSNDPSSDLDPKLTHAINYDGNIRMIGEAKAAGVPNFIFASSSSVYGVKEVPNVTEDMSLEPLTQYSKLKVEVEKFLLREIDSNFSAVILRPSTICGFSPRQRLDVVVNLLTNDAVHHKKLRVFGGKQLRPNIHISDMVRLYVELASMDLRELSGKIFNAGWENLKVSEIAELVGDVVGKVDVEVLPSDDNRSYHVSSEKIFRELGFKSTRTVRNAVEDLVDAFQQGQIKNPTESRYYNVRLMKSLIANL
jgi:nucleoside-diphosphate-sugar epimerase